MRAHVSAVEGYVERDWGRLHYEVHGDGGPTILLLPTWTIIHKQFWKAQVPYLARHHRVVVFDGPGNGRSDRPTDPRAYDSVQQARNAVAVLDATDTDRAVVVALSQGAYWALDLAANHSERVLGTALIGASLPLSPPHAHRAATGWQGLGRSRVPILGVDPPQHWAKYDAGYWTHDYEDFLWMFFGRCFTEPHSTKQVEDCVGWGLETSPEVLVVEAASDYPDGETVREWCSRIRTPVVAIHGTDDDVSPCERSRVVADLTGGDLVLIEGAGHIPLARDPVKVNLLLREFALRCQPATSASPAT